MIERPAHGKQQSDRKKCLYSWWDPIKKEKNPVSICYKSSKPFCYSKFCSWKYGSASSKILIQKRWRNMRNMWDSVLRWRYSSVLVGRKCNLMCMCPVLISCRELMKIHIGAVSLCFKVTEALTAPSVQVFSVCCSELRFIHPNPTTPSLCNLLQNFLTNQSFFSFSALWELAVTEYSACAELKAQTANLQEKTPVLYVGQCRMDALRKLHK